MAEEKKKKPVGKIIAIVAVVLVIVALFGGAGTEDKGKEYSADSSASVSDASQNDSTETSSAEQEEPEAKYVITDETLDTSEPYFAHIKGTLINNSGKDLNYIGLEYVLYDADGAQIGTAYENTTNLKAGGVWKFEAAILEDADSVASFELADVSAW